MDIGEEGIGTSTSYEWSVHPKYNCNRTSNNNNYDDDDDDDQSLSAKLTNLKAKLVDQVRRWC